MPTKTDKMSLAELISVASEMSSKSSELLKLTLLEHRFAEGNASRAFDRGFSEPLSEPEDDVLKTLFNVQDKVNSLIKELERIDKHVDARAFELIIKHKVLIRYLGEGHLSAPHAKRCEEICQKFKVNPYSTSE